MQRIIWWNQQDYAGRGTIAPQGHQETTNLSVLQDVIAQKEHLNLDCVLQEHLGASQRVFPSAIVLIALLDITAKAMDWLMWLVLVQKGILFLDS